MNPTTKRILGSIILLIGAVIVGQQAWQVGQRWWDMHTGLYDLISPFWYVNRALYTAFAFYGSVAAVRVIHQQRVWILSLWGVIALAFCFTRLVYVTYWGLPTFVGVHAGALAIIIARYLAVWVKQRMPQAESAQTS